MSWSERLLENQFRKQEARRKFQIAAGLEEKAKKKKPQKPGKINLGLWKWDRNAEGGFVACQDLDCLMF